MCYTQNRFKALLSACVLSLIATAGWLQSLTWLGTLGGIDINRDGIIDVQLPNAQVGLAGTEADLEGMTFRDWLDLARIGLPSGDASFDGCVDDADLLAVLYAFGQTGDLPEDVNDDGVVDDADLLIVLSHFGSGC